MVQLRPCTIQGNVDMFLDAFHNILNVTCHRPPARLDKGGVSMKCNCWIGYRSQLLITQDFLLGSTRRVIRKA